jgi:hypothetical protein
MAVAYKDLRQAANRIDCLIMNYMLINYYALTNKQSLINWCH